MPTAEELYHILHKKPFQPFRLHLTAGKVYEVRFPELNVACTEAFVYGVPVPNDPDPFAERTFPIMLDVIDRVELLPIVVSSAE